MRPPPDSPWDDLDAAMIEYKKWIWSLDDPGVEVLLNALEPSVGTPEAPLRLVLLTCGILGGAPVPAPGWPAGMELLRMLQSYAVGEVTEVELLGAVDEAAPPMPFAEICAPDAVAADVAWCRQRVALTGCTVDEAMQAVPGGDSFAREVIAIREPRRSDEPGSAVEAACASAWRSVMRTTPVWAETVVAACRGLGHLEDHQWKRAEMVWLFSAEGDVARGAVLAGASTATEVLRVMATSQRAGLDVMWARADALTRQIWPEVRELRRLAAGEVEGAHSGVVALLGSDDPENVAQGLELWRVDGVAQERMEAEEAEARGETS